MKLMKVFEASEAPQEVWEIICEIATELHQIGNDSYCPWNIGGDAEGYVSRRYVNRVDEWLFKQDPTLTSEESVLLFISW